MTGSWMHDCVKHYQKVFLHNDLFLDEVDREREREKGIWKVVLCTIKLCVIELHTFQAGPEASTLYPGAATLAGNHSSGISGYVATWVYAPT